jgi:acyl-CoA synthetase (AMP-forming)/AMP-acid ligase II
VLDPPNGHSGEEVVIVAERAVGADRTDPASVTETVRAAVSRQHRIRIADVRLVAAGTIPRTTSGKLARNGCRAEYIAGRFNR